MKAHAFLVAVGLLAACQRDLPTAGTAAGPTVSLTANQASIARIAITDAVDRIVPALFRTEAASLASSLTRMLATLGEGPVDQVALAEVISQLTRYERTTDTHGAELEVIRLALGTVQP